MSLKFAIMVGLYVLTEISAKDDCTQGKSYWCLNLRNAKACNAVEECVSLWAEKPETTNYGTMCKFCEQVLSKVEGLAEGKEVKKLSTELEDKCNLVELESERRRCKDVADGLAPEVVEALLNIPNPQKICSVIDICPRSADDEQKEREAVVRSLDVEYIGDSEDQPRPIQKRKIPYGKIFKWAKKGVPWLIRPKSTNHKYVINYHGIHHYPPIVFGRPQYGGYPIRPHQFGRYQYG